jgi:predicted nucleotidyltransferase
LLLNLKSMLETLISSKTRVKLLLKFFLNANTKSYLRGLESEFGESTNAIRLEVNRLEKAGMLSSFAEGNKKMFRANVKHPLFREVHNILLKHVGIDQIIEKVIIGLGKVEKVYLVGDFAKGLDSKIIDLIFVGDIDKFFLLKLIEKVEDLISRKIRYIILTNAELGSADWNLYAAEPFLIWAEETSSNKTKKLP